MKLASLLTDPPPTHAFELSEQGIAFALIAEPARMQFKQLDAGVLAVSPAHANILQPHTVLERIHALVPPNGQRKRRAALVLPDYCARVAVLDFDAFPAQPEEQLALLRFRLKKSVPFDVDTAMVSYMVQSRGASGKVEVLAAVISADIVTEYETPFRAAGFHPGFVTTSSLATLNLIDPGEISLLVKLSGRVLSVFVLDGTVVKLARCIEMDTGGAEEIDSVLHPTIAYVEDELKTRPQRIWLSGFADEAAELAYRYHDNWGMALEPLRSPFGSPGPGNAGLLGYLQSVAG